MRKGSFHVTVFTTLLYSSIVALLNGKMREAYLLLVAYANYLGINENLNFKDCEERYPELLIQVIRQLRNIMRTYGVKTEVESETETETDDITSAIKNLDLKLM